jgi:DnaJ-class molecular chaperone
MSVAADANIVHVEPRCDACAGTGRQIARHLGAERFVQCQPCNGTGRAESHKHLWITEAHSGRQYCGKCLHSQETMR